MAEDPSVDKTQRRRRWCFTLNNWTEKELEKLREEFSKGKLTYAIIGQEIGDTGTPHLQGFVNYWNGKSFNRMKTLIGKRCHLEGSRGHDFENFEYCSKQSKFDEFGERPKEEAPKRTDIETIRDLVKTGTAKMTDLYETARSYQALRFGEIGLGLYTAKRNWKTHVTWIYGPTGTGKSHYAFQTAINPWVTGQIVNNFIFAGYNGEEDVIIEDFRPEHMSFNMLLRMCDKYPLRVRTIGGSVEFLAKRIFVTTTKHPGEFYAGQDEEDCRQLLRRIELIMHLDVQYDEKNTICTLAQRSGGNTKPPPCAKANNL